MFVTNSICAAGDHVLLNQSISALCVSHSPIRDSHSGIRFFTEVHAVSSTDFLDVLIRWPRGALQTGKRLEPGRWNEIFLSDIAVAIGPAGSL